MTGFLMNSCKPRLVLLLATKNSLIKKALYDCIVDAIISSIYCLTKLQTSDHFCRLRPSSMNLVMHFSIC